MAYNEPVVIDTVFLSLWLCLFVCLFGFFVVGFVESPIFLKLGNLVD